MTMKKKTTKKKASPKYGLKAQIEDAQRAIKSWPKWMKELARFEGTNHERNDSL